MKELITTTKTIDSREVAQMLGKDHGAVMKDIQGSKDGKTVVIIPVLEKSKFDVSEYFIESSYKTEGNNKCYPCYLITKLGCEMLGNKQQGEKGIIFTAKYVKKFNEMEQVVQQPQKLLTPMEQLRLQYEVIEEHEERVTKIENQLERLEVNPSQRKAIQNARHRRVSEILGGKMSLAYQDKSFRSKVYSDMGRAFNNYFDVPTYDCTPKNRFSEALELIEAYNLSAELNMELKRINNKLMEVM